MNDRFYNNPQYDKYVRNNKRLASADESCSKDKIEVERKKTCRQCSLKNKCPKMKFIVAKGCASIGSEDFDICEKFCEIKEKKINNKSLLKQFSKMNKNR